MRTELNAVNCDVRPLDLFPEHLSFCGFKTEDISLSSHSGEILILHQHSGYRVKSKIMFPKMYKNTLFTGSGIVF